MEKVKSLLSNKIVLAGIGGTAVLVALLLTKSQKNERKVQKKKRVKNKKKTSQTHQKTLQYFSPDDMIHTDTTNLNNIMDTYRSLKSQNVQQYGMECVGDIIHCGHCNRLIETIQTYNAYISNDNPSTANNCILDEIDMKKALNDYLHTLSNHNTDTDIEFISDQLLSCDINQCVAMKRNYRNRKIENNSLYKTYTKNVDTNAVFVLQQMFDKMHCNLQHCFDIGLRFTAKETEIIKTNIIAHEFEPNENTLDTLLKDDTIIQMQKIVINKRKTYKKIGFTNNRMKNKYNALNYSVDEKSNDKMYHFGYVFDYGSPVDYFNVRNIGIEANGPRKEFPMVIPIKVTEKHASLKEELISNSISVLTIQQYHNEYIKATLYLKSDYCKQKIRPYQSVFTKKAINFSIENVLSLLIYCNFTALQYEFSKTYREDNGGMHRNFFHMGKNMKMCVHLFGTKLKRCEIESFYHGITEVLKFDEYIGGGRGINMNCPLSTSSSKVVALNFAGMNRGIVVEFANGSYGMECRSITKCFSAEWLSDFTNECEYIFIQNAWFDETLRIVDIIDTQNGYEYKNMLRALTLIVYNCTVYAQMNMITDREKKLMSTIINHRLSSWETHNDLYINYVADTSKLLNDYAQNIIDNTFKDVKRVKVNYSHYKTDCPFFFDLLCEPKYEWIKLKEISVLFPNFDGVVMCDVHLNESILNHILNYLSDANNSKNCRDVTIVMIIDQDKSNITLEKAFCRYRQQFEKISWFIDFDHEQMNEQMCHMLLLANWYHVDEARLQQYKIKASNICE